MGVADGQSVSFSDFWTLIQSVATSQHSILSGQGGPSCSCILLWPVRHSILTIANFVLPRIPLSQCVTCPCPLSSRCSADSTGQRCSEQKLLQEYRIATVATIKMRSQSSRFPNYFISVVFWCCYFRTDMIQWHHWFLRKSQMQWKFCTFWSSSF